MLLDAIASAPLGNDISLIDYEPVDSPVSESFETWRESFFDSFSEQAKEESELRIDEVVTTGTIIRWRIDWNADWHFDSAALALDWEALIRNAFDEFEGVDLPNCGGNHDIDLAGSTQTITPDETTADGSDLSEAEIQANADFEDLLNAVTSALSEISDAVINTPNGPMTVGELLSGLQSTVNWVLDYGMTGRLHNASDVAVSTLLPDGTTLIIPPGGGRYLAFVSNALSTDSVATIFIDPSRLLEDGAAGMIQGINTIVHELLHPALDALRDSGQATHVQLQAVLDQILDLLNENDFAPDNSTPTPPAHLCNFGG
ncbi:MAG: hypothetical protein V3U82_07985 [Robiginitomaculum sp.]